MQDVSHFAAWLIVALISESISSQGIAGVPVCSGSYKWHVSCCAKERMTESATNMETKSADTSLDRDSLKRVRNLMLLTAKTLKSMNTYPSNSPVVAKQKDRLHKEFQSFLSAHNILTVAVSESGLLIGDQVIYEEETRSKNLAFLLYKDGLREISFYEGITSRELDEFLDALAENWLAPEETDVVSLLWEKDFSNILYTAIDEIFRGVAESANKSSGADGAGASETISRDGKSSSGTITLSSADAEQLKRAGSGSMRAEIGQTETDLGGSETILLNDQELEEIERIVSNDKRVFNPPRELADALFEMLTLERDPSRYNSILKVLKEYLSGLISHADFKTACEVILALSKIENSASLQHLQYRTFVETILEDACSPQAIKKIRQLLHRGITGSLDHLFRYVSLLGPNAAPVLVDILLRIEDPEIHSKARNLLADFARTDPGYLEEWLFDPRIHLVRQFVSILGQAGLERAIPYLERCVDRQDADLRKDVIRALSRIGGISADRILVEFFGDPSPEVCILAIRSLSNLHPETIEIACDLVRQRQFSKKKIVEKKAWVDFLRKSGSDSVVSVLRNLLHHRNWFRRKENNQFKMYVASALGSIATDAAMEVLREGIRMRNRKLKNACQHALEKASTHDETSPNTFSHSDMMEKR